MITPLKNPAPFFNNSNRNRSTASLTKKDPQSFATQPTQNIRKRPSCPIPHFCESPPSKLWSQKNSRKTRNRSDRGQIPLKTSTHQSLKSTRFHDICCPNKSNARATAKVFNIPRPSTNQRVPRAKISLNLEEKATTSDTPKHLRKCAFEL